MIRPRRNILLIVTLRLWVSIKMKNSFLVICFIMFSEILGSFILFCIWVLPRPTPRHFHILFNVYGLPLSLPLLLWKCLYGSSKCLQSCMTYSKAFHELIYIFLIVYIYRGLLVKFRLIGLRPWLWRPKHDQRFYHAVIFGFRDFGGPLRVCDAEQFREPHQDLILLVS